MSAHVAFGLRFDSELPLPEAPPGAGPADVHVRLAPPPDALEDPTVEGVLFQARPDAYLLDVPGVARYSAHGGSEIRVEPAEGAAPEAVRHFLLGPVMAALLHQRGVLPLHASAVAGARGACVIAGASGAGKSSLAAVLHRRGYRVLADDVAAFVEGRVHPGLPQLHVPLDVLSRLGLSGDPLRAGVPKRGVAVPESSDPEPVRLLIHLVCDGHTVTMTAVRGVRALETLSRAIHLPALAPAALQVRAAGALTGMVRRLARPEMREVLQEMADLVEREIA